MLPELHDVSKIRIQAYQFTSAYYIPVRIHQQKLVMLFDSGCTRSLLLKKVLEILPSSCYSKLLPVRGSEMLANGQQMLLEGMTNLKFRLGPIQLQHQFVVSDVDNPFC